MSALIHASTRAAFVPFTAPLEGVVPHLYLDVRGLVTVAIGCLVDPLPLALSLPLVTLFDGSPATRTEIEAEWRLIKSHTELAHKGAGAARKLCSLRLTPQGVEQVVGVRLDEMVAALVKRFPELPAWPAAAQLATLSMAWACGCAFRFPKLDAALRLRRFEVAADECKMREEGNPGLAPRNVANRELYLEAGRNVAMGLNPSVLEYVDRP